MTAKDITLIKSGSSASSQLVDLILKFRRKSVEIRTSYRLRFINKMRYWVLFILTILPADLLAQDLSDFFKELREGVVIIATEETKFSISGGLQPTSMIGQGSGFYIGGGKILTAAHVVQTANQVLVTFYNGHESFANVTASSVQADVALLELEEEPTGIAPIKLGDSDKVEVGQEVFVIGAPYGLSYTLTVGHISGRIQEKETTSVFTDLERFQTDAAINQGNSGGPLFNLQGEVVGIVSSILSQSGGFEGIGFATTVNVARTVLLENQSFWWGADGLLLTESLAALLNVPQPAGFLVQHVAADSPAEKLGLNPGFLEIKILGNPFMIGGDIVLNIQGTEVTAESLGLIQRNISSLQEGSILRVDVLRGGKVVTLEMNL